MIAIAKNSEPLPLPDVWIPFSDNLRMFAGYGDDINVGDVTVATQASFSRASTATYIDKSGVLRTAAIGEPRFEKEGLLIEGQSTNLIVHSEGGGSFVSPYVGTTIIKDQTGFISGFKSASVSMGADTATNSDHIHVETPTQLVVGTTYTASVIVDSPLVSIITYSSSAVLTNVGESSRVLGDGRYLITWSFMVDAYTSGNYWDIRLMVTPENRPNGITFNFAAVQLEALPFATSYIPTNGSAVTRAADVCVVPDLMNIHTGSKEISMCCEASAKGNTTHIFDAGDASLLVLGSTGVVGRIDNMATPSIVTVYDAGTRALVAVSISPTKAISRLNGNVVTDVPVNTGIKVYNSLRLGNRQPLDRPLNGHIRNFRIWHKALTIAQIRGLE